jgi:ABC-type transporter Mla subunit MlaD
VQRGVATDLRWTWIFGTILILVVVVVIGFLSGITSALNSIDKALGTTDATLTDVGGDADPLPGYIQKINGNLTAIDKALKPVPGQGVAILRSLTSINGSTGRVNAALKNTSSSLLSTSSSLVDTSGTLTTISGSLTNTSGSLVTTTGGLRTILSSLRNTSGTLVTVNSRVRTINQVLRALRAPESQGVGAVPGLVSSINGAEGLSGILSDTNKINAGLSDAEAHLTSICNSTAVKALGVVAGNTKC